MLSQWRAYAADGHGYILGFDTAKLRKVQPKTAISRVIYEPTKQQQFCKVVLSRGLAACRRIMIGPPSSMVLGAAWLMEQLVYAAVPLLKDKGFHEEAETRIVSTTPLGLDAQHTFKFTYRDGLVVPHIVLYPPIRAKLPITYVATGPNLHHDHAPFGVKRLLIQNGYLAGGADSSITVEHSPIPYLSHSSP